jgi:hypothetical protein
MGALFTSPCINLLDSEVQDVGTYLRLTTTITRENNDYPKNKSPNSKKKK